MRRTATWALAALAVASSAGMTSACSSAKSVASDVKVSSCDAGSSGGKPVAKGEVKNSSSKDSSYAFRVSFTDSSGNHVTDGAVALSKVKAGETAQWDATGATGVKGNVTCKVENVARTAVP
ncbi:MAG TPA: hypothetical protein VHN98_00855 [Acidimicrobiales bacterium]|nr:hypothetical protein [Acidimicrobiales bacterium]